MSIAMATYNGAAYLADQLASLANQTRRPIELVICDDKSSDDTISIIKAFSKTSPFPVRLYENLTRLHFADNFLKAATLCRGDYVSFCDQDDIWAVNKLQSVARIILSEHATLVAHQAKFFGTSGTGVLHDDFSGSISTGQLFPWGFFYGFTCTFARSLLNEISYHDRPIDPIAPTKLMAHDRWIALLSDAFGHSYLIPDQLALYRQHSANDSSWMRARRGYSAAALAARRKFGFNIVKYFLIADRVATLFSNYDTAATCREERLQAASLAEVRWRNLSASFASRLPIALENKRYRRLRAAVRAARFGSYGQLGHQLSTRRFFLDLVLAIVAEPHQVRTADSMLPLRTCERAISKTKDTHK